MNDDNPCVGVCEIDDGYCIGCGRSADEIFGETDSAPDESAAVATPVQPTVGGQPPSAD